MLSFLVVDVASFSLDIIVIVRLKPISSVNSVFRLADVLPQQDELWTKLNPPR
jgi:hypothetical protein